MWSYGDPNERVLFAVRFEVQDTNERAQLLSNEEIEYAIARETPSKTPSLGEVLSAAAHCLEVLERRFAAQADTDLGSLHVINSKRAEGYAKRGKELRARAIGLKAVPWAGGLSEAEKQQRRSDADRVQPRFERGQFSSPYTGGRIGGGGPLVAALPSPGQEGADA